MENKIFRKSIRYLIVSTLLIMSFTRGNLCDWLLILNGFGWLIAAVMILAKQANDRTETQEETTPEEPEDDPFDFELPEDDDLDDIPETDEAENWYKFLGRDILTDVITDLNIRGFKRMEITEDGEIRVNDATEEQIDDFPEPDGWNTLVSEMRNDGLNAGITDDRLVVTW
ncbi:MAG: hypothetical protein IKI93_01095 [Clostridia bacterium]|nr:hypothetical protein [Oscillospiraceae bacterium]MBR3996922.1 hypothetical protein [Clostridia bacterium]